MPNLSCAMQPGMQNNLGHFNSDTTQRPTVQQHRLEKTVANNSASAKPLDAFEILRQEMRPACMMQLGAF
jgi:hypothetical protein